MSIGKQYFRGAYFERKRKEEKYKKDINNYNFINNFMDF